MIVETEVLVENPDLANMGIIQEDDWLRISIDFSKVEMIKESCEKTEDLPKTDRCEIRTQEWSIIIKLPYDQAVSIWKSEPITKNPQYL